MTHQDVFKGVLGALEAIARRGPAQHHGTKSVGRDGHALDPIGRFGVA